MGKCLEFGKDNTPKHQDHLTESAYEDIKKLVIQPRSIRFRRELFIDAPRRVSVDQDYLEHLVQQVNATEFNWSNGKSRNEEASVSEIAFDAPIDVDVEAAPHVEFDAYVSTSACHLFLRFDLLCLHVLVVSYFSV